MEPTTETTRTAHFLLVCPHNARHDLATVASRNGQRSIRPHPDPFERIRASAWHVAAPDVPLAELATLCRVTLPTILALVRAGLPHDPNTLTATEHDVEEWPGMQRGHDTGTAWAWTCWPCLREGRTHATCTGTLSYASLTRLLAAVTVAAPPEPKVPASPEALDTYTSLLTASVDGPAAEQRVRAAREDMQRVGSIYVESTRPMWA